MVHVHYTPTDDVTDGDLDEIRAWLPAEEIHRADRLHFEEDRRLHLTAQAHIRGVLSTFVAINPAGWRIERSAAGKPGVPDSGLQFSYSHTRGMVVSVVTRGPLCGIDVEDVTKPFDLNGVAPAVLGSQELIPDLTADRFFQLWTLKEAYSKALGLGLRLDFRQAQFTIRNGTPILIGGEQPWSFGLAKIGAKFQVAVAAAAQSFLTVEPRRWRLTNSLSGPA